MSEKGTPCGRSGCPGCRGGSASAAVPLQAKVWGIARPRFRGMSCGVWPSFARSGGRPGQHGGYVLEPLFRGGPLWQATRHCDRLIEGATCR